MMIIDISNDDVLMSDSLGFFLGVPQTKALCTGDLSGKTFKVPDAPIYPTAGMGVLPTIEDIIAYSRVSTIVSGITTNTDTIVEVDDLVEHEDYPGLYDGFELTSIPSGADAVLSTYVEMLEPFIAQGVEPKLKQTTKEVPRINSNDTMTAYGRVNIEIKSEQIMSKQTIQFVQKLMFPDIYDGPNTAADGYSAYDLKPKPLSLYGYENIRWEDDLLGRIYFEEVTIQPDLPNTKADSTVGFTLQMNVAKMPRLVLPDPV